MKMSFLQNLLMSRKNILVFLGFLLFGGILSGILQYEITWDFRNYHYYNGFAFLNNRLDIDIATASILTYLNPLLDTVIYLLYKGLMPHTFWYSFVTGLPFGILLFIFFKICMLYFDMETKKGKVSIVAAMLIGLTGFATWFQIGTSSHEITLACLVLSAFLILISETAFTRIFHKKTFFMAGLLLGAAAGLKLSAAIYCISTGITLILFYKHIEKPITLIGMLILGGLCGFLLTNGFWMWELWQRYGNPVFPFWNSIFKSPYFDSVNYVFEHSMDHLPLYQKILLPLTFLNHKEEAPIVAITDFSDPRFLLMMSGGVIWLFQKKDKAGSFLVIWLLFSYVFWFLMGRQIRFAVAMEMLTAILLIKVIIGFPIPKKLLIQILYAVILIDIFAILILTPVFSVPWGKVADFKLSEMAIPENTLLLTRGAGNSYYAARIAENTNIRVINKIGCCVPYWDFASRGNFAKESQNIIDNHKGDVVMIISIPKPVNFDTEGMNCSVISYGKLPNGEKTNITFVCAKPDLMQSIFKKTEETP